MISCQYCIFYSSGDITRTESISKDEKICFLYCKQARVEINMETKICKHFKPSITFYCNYYNERYHLLACNNRKRIAEDKNNPLHKAYVDLCARCKQHNSVLAIIKGYHSLLKKKKPTLIKPIRPSGKITRR